jgi:hypothetical protein
VTADPGLLLRGALDLYAHGAPEFTTDVYHHMTHDNPALVLSLAEATV